MQLCPGWTIFLCAGQVGLIIQRHNEIRDAIGDLAALAWSSVKREPIVKEAYNGDSSDVLVADLCIRGVWLPQAEALFEIRIIDTDAQSYLSQPPASVILTAEKEQKRKYLNASVARRAHSPLCFWVDGVAGSEATSFLGDLLLVYLHDGRDHLLM